MSCEYVIKPETRGFLTYPLRYITGLYTYLLSFTKRTQPLIDAEQQQQEAEAEFQKLWEQGQITGWGDVIPNGSTNGSEGVYCTACRSFPNSRSLFRLIVTLGQKMYAKQTVYDAHLKSKKHLNAAAREEASAKSTTSTSTQNQTNGHGSSVFRPPKHYKAALMSHVILPLVTPLIPTIAESKSNIERRFALTSRERELEAEAPQQASLPAAQQATSAPAEEEEEEEERIYNPLKLPLGWDGKPIPYWLYKLHGLGVEYRCEICSDAVYMGRKNFERHFQVCDEE